MESVTNKTKAFGAATALDEFFEEKVDFDIVIPDYAPAAMRILKCDVLPTLVSRSADSERVCVDVQCVAHIIYTDEQNGCIRSITKTENFSRTLPQAVQLANSKMRVGQRAVSVNCRLQNPRRISVKAVIGTALKVVGCCNVQTVDHVEDGVETVFKNITANIFSGAGDVNCHITGSLDTHPGVTDIISSGASIDITDVKPITDKVIIKGNANVHIVYMTGETPDDLRFAECSVPFSDVVDVDGATDNSLTDILTSVTDVRCDVTNDEGEMGVEVDATVSASVYNTTDINLLEDAYSMNGELILDDTSVTVESLCDIKNLSETVAGTVPSDIENARIIGVSAHPVVKSISARDGSLFVDGDLHTTIYMCNETEYRISDKTVPFSLSTPAPSGEGNMRCEATATVKNIGYTMPDDDNITLSATLDIALCCFEASTHRTLSTVSPDPDSVPHTRKGVVLYNAERGENLWDIAKKYRSSVNIIKRDNNIDDDTLDNPRMLLISFN